MKRTTKAKVRQATLYGVLLAAVVLVAVLVDWGKVHDNFFSPAGIGNPFKGDWGTWPDFLKTGAKNTVLYTAMAFVLGLALALVLALMKLSPAAPYRWLATCYIEFFRGLPALIVILFTGFGIPIAFGWQPPGGTVGAGVIGLVLVAGAYMAETLRAGIQAVPKGQVEAARSLGMSGPRTMASIVIPQAFRIVIPPLTNEFVLLIKDTSLLFVLGFAPQQLELATQGRDGLTSGDTAGTSTSLLQVAVFYLLITLPLTRLVAYLEKKQQRAR